MANHDPLHTPQHDHGPGNPFVGEAAEKPPTLSEPRPSLEQRIKDAGGDSAYAGKDTTPANKR